MRLPTLVQDAIAGSFLPGDDGAPARAWWSERPPERIGVFRALVLGDMLCAVPALRALKAAWPDAELTLIGLPWAHELAGRLSMVDSFIEFPGFPGLPETIADLAALPDFLRRMQDERFDLLLQMHGSGTITNPLVAACGARHTAGFHEPGAFVPDGALFRQWPKEGHEIERLLQLVDHLRIPRCGTALEFPVTDTDRIELASLWPGAFGAQPFVCIHPGAQLPSRRWPAERFAQVADVMVERGCQVVLTGTGGEAALALDVRNAMRHEAVDLVGHTNLWTLGALLERARMLICNDTGVSHIAAALGTLSVVVSSGADVARWAPLNHALHQVLWHDVPCRPCGHAKCPYGHECAQGITVDMVAEATHAVDIPETINA